MGAQIEALQSVKLRVQTRNLLQCAGMCQLKLQFGEVETVSTFMVVTGQATLILGRPWMQSCEWHEKVMADGTVQGTITGLNGVKATFKVYDPTKDPKYRTVKEVRSREREYQKAFDNQLKDQSTKN